MRILATGANGQVTTALSRLHTPGIEIVKVGRPELDIVDKKSVVAAIRRYRPDIVVNPAAYTAVDKAEDHQADAFAANERGAANVARAAAEAGLPVIHLSTDYVFSGNDDGAYAEDDAVGPTGVYGASKLAGERAVAEANARHVILRTAWVYSPWGANFVRTMLRLAGDRDVVRVVADQHGTPTYAPDIAEAIARVSSEVLEHDSSDHVGVFHMTAEGHTTWAGFAAEIFRVSAELSGPTAQVEPITTSEYPTPARRPANSRLSTAKFKTIFGHEMGDWRKGVRACVTELLR